MTKSGGAESEELKTLRMPVVGFTECSNKADYFRPFLVADKFCGGKFNKSFVNLVLIFIIFKDMLMEQESVKEILEVFF